MKKEVGVFLFALGATVTGGAIAQTSGGAIAISPVQIISSDQSKAEVITVTNDSDRFMRFQVNVYEWTSVEGKRTLNPTADVQASPAMLDLEPHAKRVIRVVRLKPVVGKSSYYRVLMRDLTEVGKKHDGVTVALEHSIPISFEPEKATAALLTAERVEGGIKIKNGGAKAARIAEFGPTTGKPWFQAVGWLLPGAWALIPTPKGAEKFDISGITMRVNGTVQAVPVK